MRLAILGYPLSHTLSPVMQNAALAAAGLSDWRYEVQPVEPARLSEAVANLRGAEFAGGNVTVPHKEAIIPLLDGLTPVARAIGAVNVIFKQGDQLIGDNTDAAGLQADLRALMVNVAGKRVLILGAGGGARAAVAGCVAAEAQVRVVARRREQVDALQHVGRLTFFPWTRLGLLEGSDGCALILNCTPLGMSPNVEASPWLETVGWPAEAFAYDLVYNPSETRFVRQARAAGLRAATGLGMLVEQGALSFERWTGQPAPLDVMRQAAREALAARENDAS